MKDTFQLELISPKQIVFSGEIVQADIPGADGYMGIMAHHAPVVTLLAPGVMALEDSDGKQSRYFIQDGIAQANPDGLRVLAESIDDVDALTAEALEARISVAKQQLEAANDDNARTLGALAIERLEALR